MAGQTRGISWTRILLVVLVVVSVAGYVVYKHEYGVPGTSPLDRLRAKPLRLDLDAYHGNLIEADIKRNLHHLHFTCTIETSTLGDRVCWAPISSYNDVDAEIADFFFKEGKLSNIRLSFSGKVHPQLFLQMHKKFGPVRTFKKSGDIHGNSIVGWVRPKGIIAISDHIEPQHEAIVLWISGEKMFAQVFGKHLNLSSGQTDEGASTRRPKSEGPIYAPSTITAFIEKSGPLVVGDGDFTYQMKLIGAEAYVTYSGESRPIEGMRRKLIDNYFLTNQRPGLASMFKHEILVLEGGQKYWLPIDDLVLNRLKANTGPNVQITISYVWLGTVKTDTGREWVFAVRRASVAHGTSAESRTLAMHLAQTVLH